MLESSLIELVRSKLRPHEGYSSHLYLDSVGVVTVGIGHALVSESSIASLIFYFYNEMNSSIDVTKKADSMAKIEEYRSVKNLKFGNYRAKYYEKKHDFV